MYSSLSASTQSAGFLWHFYFFSLVVWSPSTHFVIFTSPKTFPFVYWIVVRKQKCCVFPYSFVFKMANAIARHCMCQSGFFFVHTLIAWIWLMLTWCVNEQKTNAVFSAQIKSIAISIVNAIKIVCLFFSVAEEKGKYGTFERQTKNVYIFQI